ncbi:hypothetical protein ACSSS7_006026 [Eimeria intestinalis]
MGRHKTRVTETVQGPASSGSELLAGAQKLLEATASRMRTEVQGLNGDLVDQKLLLLQQLNHLDAALVLLGRLLPTSSGPDMKPLPPDDLCEAGRHLNMAVHTMLALAPKFREATHQRLLRHLGSGHSSKFECCSRRRPAAELSPQKRRRRMRTHLAKLEKSHESCLLDLLLSFEYVVTAERPPSPDTPARCAEGVKYVLAGQAKLHQSHVMLCQLLVEEDDLLLPILEWQLGAAASDFAVARAVIDRLPRASAHQTRKKSKGHSTPTATVGIRCESKASFVHSANPASVRFAVSGQQSSPGLAASHLPPSPGAVVMKNIAHNSAGGTSPDLVCHAVRPCIVADRTSHIHTGLSDDLAGARPNPRNSTPFPDLAALGPCHHCRSRSASPNNDSPVFQKHSCKVEDCPPKGCVCSRYTESRSRDISSWTSAAGVDFWRR